MNVPSLRTALAGVCVIAACFAANSSPNAAQAPKPATPQPPVQGGAEPPRPSVKTSPVIAHFSAKSPYEGDSGSPARIDIMIERWSTDKDLENLRAAFAKSGAEGLLPALQGMGRRAGVLMMPGVGNVGARARLRRPVNLYFAHEVQTPKGRQIIFASDHYLAFGKPTAEWPEDFQFSLLDVRFAADGTGIGKVAAASKVTDNKQTKTIEADGYDGLPPGLIEVKPDTK
jgi:hypothetical protein